MKTFPLSFAILLGSVCAALPQGGITFGNNLPSLRAPIFGPEEDWVHFGGDWANAKTGNTATNVPAGTQIYNGARLESLVVSFWAAPGMVTDGHLLSPGTTTTTLGTGSLAGYFPATAVLFPGLPESGVVTVQVRVYDPTFGYSFGGIGPYGGLAAASALFTAEIGSTATLLRSFSAGWLNGATLAPYVPEPSSAGLLLLGGALLLRRRRESR